MHMAAQGNKPLSIHFFCDKLDINSTDAKLRTPLHWAVYTRSEHSQAFILAMPSVNLESKDDNGFTALHLAVQSVEQLKSTRPVRALLLKGADRDAQDNKERKPVELIDLELPEQLRQELRSILVTIYNSRIHLNQKQPCYFEWSMIKAPIIKLEKNRRSETLFWVINGLVFFIMWFILFPSKNKLSNI